MYPSEPVEQPTECTCSPCISCSGEGQIVIRYTQDSLGRNVNEIWLDCAMCNGTGMNRADCEVSHI